MIEVYSPVIVNLFRRREEKIVTTNHRLPNYINGRWQNSSAKEFADVINPATGETLAQAPA